VSVDAALFTFAHDIVDEGAGAVVANVVDRAGANGVLMAVTYHDGRDVFPHGRTGHVRYLEPGVAYFRPNEAAYADSPIKPRASALAAEVDPLEALLSAARPRDVDVHAWAIFLHHDRIGDHLAYTPRNAFGDPIKTDLCASNPAARAWSRALARDVASRGVSSIFAEAVQFFPLEHGVHHERYFLDLGPRTRFLLGLCFCDSCLAVARSQGIDGARLRAWVAGQITDAFDGEVDDPAGELSRAEIGELASGDLGAWLRMREGVVTSLTLELREVVAEFGVRLTLMDPSGARKGYATGRPTGDPSPTIAWQLGMDLAGLASATDTVEMIGYAADTGWIANDVAAYRNVLGAGTGLNVALRPAPPDSSTAENLRAKVELATRAGVRRVDFYHYGLIRLDALDRIRLALHG
jgi:hypothetical protein